MLSNITMYVALPVRNLDEAMNFYGGVLGLNIVDENANGVWYQTGESRIAVYESSSAGTNKGTCAILEVTDPKGAVEALKSQGVVFERYSKKELPNSRRRGDIHIVGNFKAAWFKDPSGNIISIGSHL